VRRLQAPAQPMRGKTSAGRAAGASPIRAPRVLHDSPPHQLRIRVLLDGRRKAGKPRAERREHRPQFLIRRELVLFRTPPPAFQHLGDIHPVDGRGVLRLADLLVESLAGLPWPYGAANLAV
jgi:hypothetical protein